MAGHRGDEPRAAQGPGEPRAVGLTSDPGPLPRTDHSEAAGSRPLVERWPSAWQPEVEERVAVTAFVLSLCTHEWVHRRVESITFIDENRIRRRVSVDFTLPDLPRELLRTSRVRGQSAAKRSRRTGRTRPPSGVREAVETVGLDLHGFPVESAEGWRAGFENMDGEGQLERTMGLAEEMNARRSLRSRLG